MRTKYVGQHRRQPAPSKGALATVAVAAGTATMMGVTAGTATAAPSTAPTAEAGTDAGLADGSSAGASAASRTTSASSPQILAIPQTKSTSNLSAQLAAVIEYNKKREAEEAAARGPKVVRPAEGTLTTGFEMRWGQFHKGIDIANAIGTPEYAVMDATVISAGPASGFGNWVRLQADDGTVFVYGHMETINVKVGQRVSAGDVIAGMGSRGFSTGSHLHFEVHPNGGDAIDPIPWLQAHGIEMGAIYR